MPPADNTPDFDKMTPEEIMAWMESLAKRQGADQGFTTSADMVIPEIDPTTVVIDEPGYIPSEGKMKGKKIESIIPSKPAAPKAAEPAKPAAAPPPVAAAPPPPVAAAAPPPPKAEPEATSALSWLESLAADQGGDFPALDLSSIAADLVSTSTPAAAVPEASNPVDWLENLAQSQGVEDTAPLEVVAPAESGDPVSWLESLAKRQGAPIEELTTEANLDVPIPEHAASDGPGYTDYTFETPDTVVKQTELNVPAAPSKVSMPSAASSDLQDPAAWLDALASSQGASEPKPTERQMSDDEIQKALAKGEHVPHDQMEAWMNRQLEIGAQRPEPEELVAYDPDAPAVKAEIPDWLIEQVGQAPPEEVAQPLPPSAPPLTNAIVEPPAVADMPDWLKDEMPSSSELENIFAPTPTDAPAAPALQSAIEIDPNDPWVEALEMEYAQGKGVPSEAPAPLPAAPATTPAAALRETALQPETELPAGEPEPVPDWLQGITAEADAAVPGDVPDWLLAEVGEPAVTEQPAVAGDMPDWLKAADIDTEEVPSWLTETLVIPEEVVVAPPPPPAVPAAPAAPRPAARPISPAPIPATALQIDVAATLQAARSQVNSNDIEGCLQNYELLIRANAELEAVVGDLTKLSEKVKTQPAVFRVLGDGLMRQGNLQAALDIYRKALNQL